MREKRTHGSNRVNPPSLQRQGAELRKHLRQGQPEVADRQDPKALDYFTSTIIPCRTFRTVAVLTIKHALLLIGFAVATMVLIRLLLAD